MNLETQTGLNLFSDFVGGGTGPRMEPAPPINVADFTVPEGPADMLGEEQALSMHLNELLACQPPLCAKPALGLGSNASAFGGTTGQHGLEEELKSIPSEDLAFLRPDSVSEPESEPALHPEPAARAVTHPAHVPAGWEPHMKDLTTPQLNRYMKKIGLSEQAQREIRNCRRRLKNRDYAKVSRARRLANHANLRERHQKVARSHQQLCDDVQRLEKDNGNLRRKIQFMARLLSSTGMSEEALEEALALTIEEA